MLHSVGFPFSNPSGIIPFRRHSSLPGLSHVPKSLRHRPWRPRHILDPRGPIIRRWNRVFLISCLIALFTDPFFFYLLYIGGDVCMSLDSTIGILVTFFRSITDLFYIAHLLLKFRTAFVAPSSRVFGRGELVLDPNQIAMRYLRKGFAFDLIAALPIPQVNESIFSHFNPS